MFKFIFRAGNPFLGVQTTSKIYMMSLKHEICIEGVKYKRFEGVMREGGCFLRLKGPSFPVPITGEHAWLPWTTDTGSKCVPATLL